MSNFLKTILNDSEGFVYIMVNPEYPGLIKIGKSKDEPIIRAHGLSKSTSAIGSFKPHWYKQVSTMSMAEAVLQFAFRKFHFEKEFFNIKTDKAISIAESAIEEFIMKDKKLQISLQFMKLNTALEYEIKNKEIEGIQKELSEFEKRINYL